MGVLTTLLLVAPAGRASSTRTASWQETAARVVAMPVAARGNVGRIVFEMDTAASVETLCVQAVAAVIAPAERALTAWPAETASSAIIRSHAS
ncbi:MAG: hypothetical protein ACYTGL_05980 [Planctomycetota bacterium]|jgi:hypothetical protein